MILRINHDLNAVRCLDLARSKRFSLFMHVSLSRSWEKFYKDFPQIYPVSPWSYCHRLQRYMPNPHSLTSVQRHDLEDLTACAWLVFYCASGWWKQSILLAHHVHCFRSCVKARLLLHLLPLWKSALMRCVPSCSKDERDSEKAPETRDSFKPWCRDSTVKRQWV